MKTLKRIALAAAIAALAAQAAWAEPDFKAMLKAVDDMGSFAGKDVSATYTMIVTKPNKPDSMFQMSTFRRDDKDQVAIITLKPEGQNGEGYLKVGDDFYQWRPSVGWTHYSISKEILNSNAKGSDFKGKRYSDDYDIVGTASVKVGKYDAWEITLKAKSNEVSYDWVKAYIRKDKPLPLMFKEYSPAPTFAEASLLRTTTVPPKYVSVDGREFPVETRMVDEVNTGNKTVMTISQENDDKNGKYLISVGYVDEKGAYSNRMPDSTFTKAFLMKTNKK
jgi:hypothetical protein